MYEFLDIYFSYKLKNLECLCTIWNYHKKLRFRKENIIKLFIYFLINNLLSGLFLTLLEPLKIFMSVLIRVI